MTAADNAAVKSRVGQDASVANFLMDLNLSGRIGVEDVGMVKAVAGMALPVN